LSAFAKNVKKFQKKKKNYAFAPPQAESFESMYLNVELAKEPCNDALAVCAEENENNR